MLLAPVSRPECTVEIAQRDVKFCTQLPAGGEVTGPATRREPPHFSRPVETQGSNARMKCMDAALAGLLGTAVGAIAGVAGGFVTGWQQRRGDAARWRQQRADEVWKDGRRSLLELTNHLAEGSQAAVWLCWAARHGTVEAVKAEATEYDARMRTILPLLFTAQAAVSGLSKEGVSVMDSLVREFTALDDSLGSAISLLDTTPQLALQMLKTEHGPALELTDAIVARVRSQLRLDYEHDPADWLPDQRPKAVAPPADTTLDSPVPS